MSPTPDSPNHKPDSPNNSNWIHKFRVAMLGCLWAFRGQSSFHVHLTTGLAVVTAAWLLRLEPWRWVALVLAIGGVLTAEMFNTAIETVVRVVHPYQHPMIGKALDAAAGAVLIAAITAAIVGAVVMGPPMWDAVFAP
jgi:diacylglycerol kinase (ATP)